MTDKRVAMTELEDSFPSRLRRVRDALELKSADMGKHLGMGASKYSDLETGKRKPDEELIAQIEGVLEANGVPAGWLANGPEGAAALPQPDVVVREIWDFEDDDLLSEISRRLFERARYSDQLHEASIPAPISVSAAAAQEAPEDLSAGMPNPPAPSHPVAPPALDIPLPMPAETPAPAPAPLPQPLPPAEVPQVVYQQPAPAPAADPVYALIGQPADPAATGPLGFEQPVDVGVVDVPLIDMLMDQYGPDGQPPAQFVPQQPAVV